VPLSIACRDTPQDAVRNIVIAADYVVHQHIMLFSLNEVNNSSAPHCRNFDIENQFIPALLSYHCEHCEGEVEKKNPSQKQFVIFP
jgi:hypothetical protein